MFKKRWKKLVSLIHIFFISTMKFIIFFLFSKNKIKMMRIIVTTGSFQNVLITLNMLQLFHPY